MTRSIVLPVRTAKPEASISLWALVLAFGSAVGADTREPPPAQTGAPTFPVVVRVDATRTIGEMRPVWRFFGYDEPNYTYMKDGQKLLGQLRALSSQPVYIRAHNLLTSGDGRPALKWGSTGVYTEDDKGRPRYNWTILDHIFDTYLERGVRPFVQIGFMPEALSAHPQPYKHDWTPGGRTSISTGWAYPPKDYSKWAELVFQWVRHSVERYGQPEVERWYWEVWNEPNILYWRGTPAEYHKLYDFAVDAVKRALPTAKVGGPHVAGPRSRGGGKFLREFLDHCVRGTNYATGKLGAPLDFIAFHAKGVPEFVDGHVRTGIAAQLEEIDRGFEIVASYPELRQRPIIIGESDPDGCAACPATIYPQNGYRNGTLYASYTAASFARKYLLADKHGVNFDGAVTWAFEFEDQPYFAGFRVLSSNGIPLPVLNVFRMFGLMGGQRLAVDSSGAVSLEAIRKDGVRASPDVAALASLQVRKLCVMVWHHHDDDLPGAAAEVELSVSPLADAGGPVLLQHFRIDSDHSNAFEAWKRMGSPQRPTPGQYAELERASNLTLLTSPEWVRPESGKVTLKFSLPRQAVSLLVLDGATMSK
jgi:xylan 1,4-beta-xylosidase